MSYDEFYLDEYTKLLELAGSGHTTHDAAKALMNSARILIAEYVMLTDAEDVANDDIHLSLIHI